MRYKKLHTPRNIHIDVTEGTHFRAIKHGDRYKNLKGHVMLTEVDIGCIMAARQQLTESAIEDADCDLIDDLEIFVMQEEDPPISETNGLM